MPPKKTPTKTTSAVKGATSNKQSARPAKPAKVASSGVTRAVSKPAASKGTQEAPRPLPQPAAPAPQLASVADFSLAPSAQPARAELGLKQSIHLWWAFMWRYLALLLLVVTPLGFVVVGGLFAVGSALGVSMAFARESYLFDIFNFLLSEYLTFLSTWLVWYLMVRKGAFNDFRLSYKIPGTPKGPVDAILPLAWGWYWRMFVLREAMNVIFTGTLVSFLAWQFKAKPSMAMLDMERYINLLMEGAAAGYTVKPALMMLAVCGLVILLYVVAQILLTRWFATKRTFRTFTLEVEGR